MNEQTIRNAVAAEITKLNNFPFEAQAQLWGRDLSKVIDAVTANVMGTGLVEQVDVELQKPSVARVEVIDDREGRGYVAYGKGVSTALQDGGRTLKVFIAERTL